jgi:hypothetical protein
MKNITTLNPLANYKLPLALLFLIALSSVGSGFLTFKLGEEAIKGVAQPEVNPTQKLIDKPAIKAGESRPQVAFKPVNISKVTKEVRAYIASQQKTTKANVKDSAQSKNAKTKTEKNKSSTATTQSSSTEGQSSAKKN